MSKQEQCDSYGCYPGVCTKFAIDDTKRGCGDWQFSGKDSSLSGCGSCCVFCVPVAFILDFAFLIPCGIILGTKKVVNKCQNNKPKVIIEIQPH